MTDSSIARITGMFGVACVLLSWAQFPLWVIEALARHLYDIRTMAFIRILMDQGIYVSMMIFAAGFRHLVRRARPESDWLGLLALASAAVWLAVTLAADGLMGGAVLATLQGTSDVSAALPLGIRDAADIQRVNRVCDYRLVHGRSGLGHAGQRCPPSLDGMDRLDQCRAVRAVHSGDVRGPSRRIGVLQPGRLGPAIIANFPPLIWFLVVGVVLIRQSRSMN
jgi:hypothetical protein